MKIFIFSLLLISTAALATYSPQTIITDANTNVTANVNGSNELETYLGADSNVCKETGGNLASILSALQGTLSTSRTWALNSGTDSVSIGGVAAPTDLIATGSLGNGSATLSLSNHGSAEGSITVTGSFVGTISLQCVYAGSTVAALPTLQTTWVTTGITTAGAYKYRGTSGCPTIQAYYSAYTSGNPSVTLIATSATGNPVVSQPNAANLNATVVQSSGTNLHVNVDSAPAVTGTVAVSSLPSIPTGANTIGSIANTAFGISGSLPSGSNTIGAISNTAFGISGSLPSGSNALGSVSVSNQPTQLAPNSDGIYTGSLAGAAAIVGGSISGVAEGTLQLSGTANFTFNIQCAYPNGVTTNLSAFQPLPVGWSNATIAYSGTPVVYKFRGLAGCPRVQVQVISYTSGSATATLETSSSTGNPIVSQPNSQSLAAGAWLNESGTQVQAGADASGNLNVDVQSSVLPTGAATAAMQTSIINNTANIGNVVELFSNFSKVIASGVDTTYFNLLQTGSGQTVSQSGGNLVLTSGTTANAETIIRSNASYQGALILKEMTILSQRIANNNFYFELVDDVGDNLSYTINSATSVTVTIPSNPFTSQMVGQSITMGVITGAAGIPGRYAIASVSGNNVTFTVAGWPASGSGTLSLFGLNYYHILYTGTTATNANFDTQRSGWNSGDTIATINTTASPGQMGMISSEDYSATFMDQLVASATTTPISVRASRVINIPSYTQPLYLQIHMLNGSTAPASTTTWTIGQLSLENILSNPVTIGNVKPQGVNAAIPVNVQNVPATTISSGTITSVATDSLATNLTAADRASSAATSTYTSGTITPTSGQISQAYQFAVTAVSGTNPTMDCVINESLDTGVTWFQTYAIERITSAYTAQTPLIRLTGNRIQEVCTIAGTSPSFTFSINRVGSNVSAGENRRFFDRSMVPTTLNSTTGTWLSEGCTTGQFIYSQSAESTEPTLTFQISEDSSNWSNTTYTLTPTGAGTFTVNVPNLNAKFSRLNTSTAGTGVTYTYSSFRCTGP